MSCGRQFVDRKTIDANILYDDYLFGKQTIRQLSVRYKISESTVRRKLSSKRSARLISRDKDVVVLMDATYCGKSFGVVVMKDSRTVKVLWRKFIYRKETLSDYKEGVDWLISNKFKIEGIVCDGLRGMFRLFGKYNVQMCQFHQMQIVKRYLTQSPELEASKELLSIIRMFCHTDKESFMGIFDQWCNKWLNFLKGRVRDKRTGKSHYLPGSALVLGSYAKKRRQIKRRGAINNVTTFSFFLTNWKFHYLTILHERLKTLLHNRLLLPMC